MGMAALLYYTADMVRAMPDDGNRYEVVYGERLVQPDVFVVVPDEARTLTWSRVQTLLLVAEVLSPSTARSDRFLKRLRYREAGVPVYWVVDGDERLVEVWTPEDDFPALERERLVWQPPGAREPFNLGLEELFRPL
jgi:Uma2 family endonuclease